jgi:hypothetical protein
MTLVYSSCVDLNALRNINNLIKFNKIRVKIRVKIGKQEPGIPFSKLLDPCLMQQ